MFNYLMLFKKIYKEIVQAKLAKSRSKLEIKLGRCPFIYYSY